MLNNHLSLLKSGSFPQSLCPHRGKPSLPQMSIGRIIGCDMLRSSLFVGQQNINLLTNIFSLKFDQRYESIGFCFRIFAELIFQAGSQVTIFPGKMHMLLKLCFYQTVKMDSDLFQRINQSTWLAENSML